MKKSLFLVIFLACTFILSAQDDSSSSPGKSGWTFGAVPAVAYDTDVGFRYGALTNIYNFGDGSRYPKYDHSFYLEWSRTTKGSGTNQFTWDSDKIIPGVRSFLEFMYLTEQSLDFYGFNGYKVIFDHDLVNSFDVNGHSNRLFYRHERKLLRIKADFQGELIGQKLRWLGGIGYFGNNIGSVDIDDLNGRKENPAPSDLLSSNSLYDNYIDWGIIKADQVNGGGHTMLKGGLVYDTRDNEPNPYTGIWTELQFHMLPSFLSSSDYTYGRLVLTHRQYFTLIPDRMNFAYRLSYQGTLFGEMPFYMMPYMFNTAPQQAQNGVGGSKTVRGILRNRVVGEDVGYANAELRYKLVKFRWINQNWYINLSAFVDAGMVLDPYELPANLLSDYPEASPYFDLNAKEVPHIGYGGGVRFVLNENFIVAVDYGMAAKATDGSNGLYIGLNFLF